MDPNSHLSVDDDILHNNKIIHVVAGTRKFGYEQETHYFQNLKKIKK